MLKLTINGQCVSMRAIGPVRASNDSATQIRASIDDLREQEKLILSELACGDAEDRNLFAELAIVRRSMRAIGAPAGLRAV